MPTMPTMPINAEQFAHACEKVNQALDGMKTIANAFSGATANDPETKTEVKGDRVVSYKEAAYRLGGVTTKTVWEFGRRGYLKFVRPYGLRKALGVTESSLAAFIAGQSPVDLTKRGRRGRHKGSGTELHTAKSRNWNEAHKEAANENRD